MQENKPKLNNQAYSDFWSRYNVLLLVRELVCSKDVITETLPLVNMHFSNYRRGTNYRKHLVWNITIIQLSYYLKVQTNMSWPCYICRISYGVCPEWTGTNAFLSLCKRNKALFQLTLMVPTNVSALCWIARLSVWVYCFICLFLLVFLLLHPEMRIQVLRPNKNCVELQQN